MAFKRLNRSTKKNHAMPKKLNFDEAHTVYDVLMQLAGASDGQRGEFIRAVWDAETPTREFRFQGLLGFGGKYWPERNKVTYYPEDRTAERDAIEQRTNAELARMSFHPSTEKRQTNVIGQALRCPACGSKAYVLDGDWDQETGEKTAEYMSCRDCGNSGPA